jgi:hypothetical protein
MANKLQKQTTTGAFELATGSRELARRFRAFYGLMAHIAKIANVSRPHVSFVLSGRRSSPRVMRIALRELAQAESGKFRRVA